MPRALGVFVLIVVALALGFAVYAVGSARASLDLDLAHTRATEALPAFAPGTRDGLVRIPARGMEFRARVAGLANAGPGLLLLHGFPETSVMWEPLLEAAAARGFRAIAFDQRGYSPGARPGDVAAYALPELHADALAVADAVGFERFHLVGHDWGSIVGWSVAAGASERVLSWASLSIPHPGAIAAARGDAGPPFYVRVFRARGVAETLLTFGDLFALRNGWGEMPAPTLDEYLAVFSEPGALTAALHWYRAAPVERVNVDAWIDPITPPVLYVFGKRDMPVFVGPRVQAEHARFMAGPFEVVELDAGHWLMQEQGEAVVGAVLRHLEAQRAR